MSFQPPEGAEFLLKNSRRLQKLALMQVIASTVAAGIAQITAHQADRLLSKSMIGNLHQWLTTQNEAYLTEFDEFSASFSLLGRARGAASTIHGGGSVQGSLESLDSLRPPQALSPHPIRGATELKSPIGAATLLGSTKGHRSRHATTYLGAASLDAVSRKSLLHPLPRSPNASERRTMDTGSTG